MVGTSPCSRCAQGQPDAQVPSRGGSRAKDTCRQSPLEPVPAVHGPWVSRARLALASHGTRRTLASRSPPLRGKHTMGTDSTRATTHACPPVDRRAEQKRRQRDRESVARARASAVKHIHDSPSLAGYDWPRMRLESNCPAQCRDDLAQSTLYHLNYYRNPGLHTITSHTSSRTFTCREIPIDSQMRLGPCRGPVFLGFGCFQTALECSELHCRASCRLLREDDPKPYRIGRCQAQSHSQSSQVLVVVTKAFQQPQATENPFFFFF